VKRTIAALFVLVALALTASPAGAAVTRNVVWRCTIADGSTVDFLFVPEHAFNGLNTANTATAQASLALNEECVVVRV
jgi:hypothetical protein